MYFLKISCLISIVWICDLGFGPSIDLLEKILVASYFPRHVHQGKAMVRGGFVTVTKLYVQLYPNMFNVFQQMSSDVISERFGTWKSSERILGQAGDFALNTFCLSEQQSLRPAWFQFVLEHKPRLTGKGRLFIGIIDVMKTSMSWKNFDMALAKAEGGGGVFQRRASHGFVE